MAVAPAGASNPDVGIDSVEEVEEALEETLAEVPAIEELVEETLADVDDLEINENAEVVVELETDDGSVVEIPDEADEAIILENAEGEVLEVELPGDGDDAEVLDDGSVVYEDAVTDTDIVVQAQEDGGVRMITVIDGADAPTAFDFDIDRDGAETMKLEIGGAVGIYDGTGELVDWVPAPWAYDAAGNNVPAWYTINGDTLVLNVDHTAVEAYPVVADPCWSCAWNKVKNTVKNNWPGWLAGFGTSQLVRLTCFATVSGISTVTMGPAALAVYPTAMAACTAIGISSGALTAAWVNR